MGKTIRDWSNEVHQLAREKGFWDHERNTGEMIALCHSELSEALEALRKGDLGNVGEELADCVIRIMDMCEGMRIDLEASVAKKHEYNKTRPYRHGKKF